jgi:hypothetical protein
MLGAMIARFQPGRPDPRHEGPVDPGGGRRHRGRTRAALVAALRDVGPEDLVQSLREGPVRDLGAVGRAVRHPARPQPPSVRVDLRTVAGMLTDAGSRAAAGRLPNALDALPAYVAGRIPAELGERLPGPIAQRLPAVRRARRRRALLRAVTAALVAATVLGIGALLVRRWWLRRNEVLDELEQEGDGPGDSGEPMAEITGTDLLDLAPTAIEPMFEPHFGEQGRL